LPPGASVLGVGCGTGASALQAKVKGVETNAIFVTACKSV
jgi:ubiquinone/menaquinone biosynthesis C-methylase UbiE